MESISAFPVINSNPGDMGSWGRLTSYQLHGNWEKFKSSGSILISAAFFWSNLLIVFIVTVS